MSAWITYMAPPDLLARVRQDRTAFATLWADLTPDQMTRRPGPQADWSMKDLLAHMVYWENLMLETIDRLHTSQPPRQLASDADVDAINAECFEANKDRSLDEVLREFEANAARVEAILAALSDDEINQPDYYPSRDGSPLLYHIIGNTFGHIADHRSDVEQYVATLQSDFQG